MRSPIQVRDAALIAAIGAAALARPAASQPFPSDPQSHAGRAWRVQKTTTGGWGDTRVVQSIAGHVIIFARHRYGLDSIVTPEQVKAATREMYDFLSWKYGNPSTVTAQWITAGYRHFDNHVAEAGFALLGGELEGPGHVIRLPKELSAYLKAEVDSLARGDTSGVCARLASNSGANSSTAPAPGSGPISQSPQQSAGQSGAGEGSEDGSAILGWACRELVKLLAAAAKESIDKMGISSAAVTGEKHANRRDSDVVLALFARRNPQLWVKAGPLRGGRALDPRRVARP